MPDVSTAAWQALKIVPYGAVLHVPAGWEALPPVPANGPEILRATGGPPGCPGLRHQPPPFRGNAEQLTRGRGGPGIAPAATSTARSLLPASDLV